MGNGRGKLDCCYCDFFRCNTREWHGHDAMYEPGECSRHKAAIPESGESALHRICSAFQGSHGLNVEAEQQLGWLEPLEDGVLYGYCYNTPDKKIKIADL